MRTGNFPEDPGPEYPPVREFLSSLREEDLRLLPASDYHLPDSWEGRRAQLRYEVLPLVMSRPISQEPGAPLPIPADPETEERAGRVLETLPDGFPLPELSLSEHGWLEFEWCCGTGDRANLRLGIPGDSPHCIPTDLLTVWKYGKLPARENTGTVRDPVRNGGLSPEAREAILEIGPDRDPPPLASYLIDDALVTWGRVVPR